MARGADQQLETASIARLFADLATTMFTRLPLYRRIAEQAAVDLDVVRRLLLAQPEQRIPNLLFAAVHDVLLGGREDVLADWYPSIPAVRGELGHRSRPVGAGPDDPWPHFRRLALGDDDVEDRLRTRATQTNEVGRSATLMPALFQAGLALPSAPPGGVRPLGIVEVGASAGLNLRYGAYGYRYQLPTPDDDESPNRGTRTVIESVGAGSRLMLECRLRGPLVPPLPDGPLPIVSAVGIDRHPLRADVEVDARWLVACQWPEELDRLDRLRAALALAREQPPIVEEGDAVDDLAGHVLAVAPYALPVVVSSWVLSFLPVDRQRAFVAELDRLGELRDLALVFAEMPEMVPGMPVPPRPDGRADRGATALVVLTWTGGERTEVRLADQHPHGRWLEWLA